MNDPGARPDRPLQRLRAWARRVLGRSPRLGVEPEDLVQEALVKGLERSVLVREPVEPPQLVWLRRAIAFDVSHRRRRHAPSARPRLARSLPWGLVELHEQDPPPARRVELLAPETWSPIDRCRWSERLCLVLLGSLGQDRETAGWLLGGRSRDATRRLAGRARGRIAGPG